ncbi:serine/arginine repetitive matrix protein 1-like [Planococcus citri]|uniref:serine/arginine repetitive matrix protein 1-like n=1 Tax=Planococcus citri TaxID=170843 RepID=UPI0031F8B048
MSSRYHTSTVTSNYNTNSDNRLDELLEDLQSTVATRPKVNGTTSSSSSYRDGSTGYKETFKSVQTKSTGKPAESSREYQFEYLNPSNNTCVIPERPKSPFYDKENIDSIPGKNVASYKTVSYHSNTKKTENQTTPVTEKPGVKFRQNINELDTLLDDLNHTQKMELSTSNHSNRLKGYDSGFLEPLDSSTPQKGHVSRFEERTFEEQKYGSNGVAPPVRSHEVKKEVFYNGEPIERYHNKYSNNDSTKDLLYTGGSLRHREPSPGRQLQEVYHYETKSSSTKKSSDPSPQRSISRNYNYESDVTDNATSYPYDYNRSPSPARSIHNYSSNTVRESTTHRSPSPVRSYYSTTSSVRSNTTPQPITKNLYSSSSKTIQETSRRETQRSPSTPPPHRSPSPMSFAQPPDPPLETSVKSYNFERNIRPQSPNLKQKFSPSDPSRDAIPGHTVISRNYKYSSQQTQRSKYPPDDDYTYRPEPTPAYTRPFVPSPSPPPEVREQRPPKHVDDLMASFSDTEHRQEVFNRYHTSRSSSTNRCPTPGPEKIVQVKKPSPPSTPTQKAEPQKLTEYRKEKVNGVAGPAVYYPPGPLFTKKEESAAMQKCEAGGGMKAKRKAKYEYKSGSKMKEDSDVKKTIVPMCCPVCCALPCAIM